MILNEPATHQPLVGLGTAEHHVEGHPSQGYHRSLLLFLMAAAREALQKNAVPNFSFP
jgi:hypothetical protein